MRKSLMLKTFAIVARGVAFLNKGGTLPEWAFSLSGIGEMTQGGGLGASALRGSPKTENWPPIPIKEHLIA
jgi:hypothetical protein